MLIGSSDSAGDNGKLRVTLHHNLFRNTGQGTPRVRFGQVHLYNNLYDQVGNEGYQYSWGVGVDSAIYAQNNFFATDAGITPHALGHDRGDQQVSASVLQESGPGRLVALWMGSPPRGAARLQDVPAARRRAAASAGTSWCGWVRHDGEPHWIRRRSLRTSS